MKKKTATDTGFFACVCGTWRTSWHVDIDKAIARAESNPGVDSVEQIGAGIVWRRPDSAL